MFVCVYVRVYRVKRFEALPIPSCITHSIKVVDDYLKSSLNNKPTQIQSFYRIMHLIIIVTMKQSNRTNEDKVILLQVL